MGSRLKSVGKYVQSLWASHGAAGDMMQPVHTPVVVGRSTRGLHHVFSRWIIAVVFVLAVGVTVGLTSPGLLPQAHAASPTILVMGDSLSAGYGINVKQGWVALLTERLQQEKFPHRVINASISGETTAGGKARLPKLLAEHQPGIVILELGANDGLRGLPVAQMQRNLAEMIAASQARGAQVVLLGMQMPNNYGANYTRSFADAYAQLAKQTTRQAKVRWLPFFLEGVAQHPELMQADSLHPNEAAQPRLLRNVWAVLKPAL